MGGALLWPRRRREWLYAGATCGTLIGFVRIAQGAHFLSDVAGSILLTWGVVLAVERLAPRLRWISSPAQ
jgi:lipid A 4'-phosphatase